MNSKQENAADDSAGVIESITGLFRDMSLPRLADAGLYLGVPFSVLADFNRALGEQRSEDDEKRFLNRLRYAGIVRERAPDTFKWDNGAYPFAEPGAIECALGLEFVRQKKNLIVVGPPGAGKSLMVLIIACKAIRAGFSVKYKTAYDISVELREARGGNSLSGYVKKLQGCDMLIIDDATFATFDSRSAQSFFAVINGRYERKATVITSNGNINEWAGKFPDKGMSTALLGRFYQEALLVNMNGAADMRLKRAKGMLENMGIDTGGEHDG